jgi:hypothetical protein
MKANGINMIREHRCNIEGEKLFKETRNRDITILLGLALLHINLARRNLLYNATFFQAGANV